MTLILEDDVNLMHSKLHSEKLKKALESLAAMPDEWDIAYLCHNPRGKTQSIVGNLDFVKTFSWHVLFGYVVSLRGAEILLKHSLPISVAVDVYIGNLAKTISYQGSPIETCNLHRKIFRKRYGRYFMKNEFFLKFIQ